ncbi:MAG: flavodoxin family protein [Planctomycetota bacterium]|jgi:NAD(P)H dehydrogenase (quinone)
MASILVLYHSQQHGNTHEMAEAVAAGAREAGAEVRLLNTNEQRLAIDDYRKVDAAAFGSPDYFSYIAGGLKVFLDDWFIAKNEDPEGLTGKPYALFYSHGGGGRVRGPLEKLFDGMGDKVGRTVESRGRPNKDVLAACRELGRQLAETAGK